MSAFTAKNKARKLNHAHSGAKAYRSGRAARLKFSNNGAFRHLASVQFVSEGIDSHGRQMVMPGTTAYVLCSNGTSRQLATVAHAKNS